jgi:aryl-alcohol dehydrogenase-like predicted oxidoreductase
LTIRVDSFVDQKEKVIMSFSGATSSVRKTLIASVFLASEKSLTAAQVALAYVMNQPMNLFALVGPHSAEKFKANVEASEEQLTPQEMDWLDLRTESR